VPGPQIHFLVSGVLRDEMSAVGRRHFEKGAAILDHSRVVADFSEKSGWRIFNLEGAPLSPALVLIAV